MLSRVKIPGRRWIPVPQSSPSTAAASRSLPDMTPRAAVIPACAGCLSWRGQVAEGSRPGGQVPSHHPGHAGRPLVCGLLGFVVVLCPCPSWLSLRPKTGLWRATRAHRNKPVGAHKNPAWVMQTSIPCASQGAPLATGDPCCVQRSGRRSDAPGTLPGRAARCEGSVMSCRPVHVPERPARPCRLRETGVFARQGMMASTVFFSALGWAGDLGAFSRARSSLAPICCSCLRPRPARTLGNQSCSSSSM